MRLRELEAPAWPGLREEIGSLKGDLKASAESGEGTRGRTWLEGK